MVPRPGDWVRFYRDGRLVLAVVAHASSSNRLVWRFDVDVMTDAGEVGDDEILEKRGPQGVPFVPGLGAGR